jgi:hypothetical protein
VSRIHAGEWSRTCSPSSDQVDHRLRGVAGRVAFRFGVAALGYTGVLAVVTWQAAARSGR